MARNTAAKVFAFFALLGIVIGIAGTGILFLTSSNAPVNQEPVNISQKDFQNMIKSATMSGTDVDAIDIITSSGSTESGSLEK